MKIDCESLIVEGEPIPDIVFEAIFAEEVVVEKQRLIEQARAVCRTQKRLTEFNNMLRAWTTQYAQRQMQEQSNVTDFTDAPLRLNCGKWTSRDSGIYKTEIKKNGDVYSIMACTHPIMPIARMKNIDTEEEKIKLAFFRDSRWQSVVVNSTTLLNRQNITVLGDRGVMVTSETARDLVSYLADLISLNEKPGEDTNAIPYLASISRLGWLKDEDGKYTKFAPYSEEIAYDGDSDFESLYRQVKAVGNRSAWYELIGELRKDLVVRLLVATSLASPLIDVVGALPFVFHLWGATSFGKTVSLMVAMSVWGNPENGCLTRTMNMTQNAMARTASFLYSLPFGADELQQIKSRWDNYDNLVMYLCEGIDRGRAKARGGVEELKTWKNCFIFTGEEPITKDNSGGGTKNRVIEVEVTKPLYADGNKVANTVRDNYGWAGKEFIEYVSQLDRDAIRNRFKEISSEILQMCDTTDKQALSMALILLADELSCESIFFSDEPLKVDDIAGYLHSNRSVDVAERAFDWALSWLAQNSHKILHKDANVGYSDIWGKYTEDSVYVIRDVLAKALQESGFDYSVVSRKWVEKGYIRLSHDGKSTRPIRFAGSRPRCVEIVIPTTDAEQEEMGVEVDEPVPQDFIQWKWHTQK